MIQSYTVVYRVEGDNAAHYAWWESLRPLFMTGSKSVSISIVSKSNEIARLDYVRRLATDHRSDTEKLEGIAALLTHADPEIVAAELWAEREKR
jgi:hypothetical protein